MARYSKNFRFLARCTKCGRSTTKKHSAAHDGQCKSCVDGWVPVGTSYDAQHAANGNEETFGMSREDYESYLNRGSYSGD